MMRDEVFTCEQAGVLATENVVWGCGGSYLVCAIQGVDYQVEWNPRLRYLLLWSVLMVTLPYPFDIFAKLFVFISLVELLFNRRVVVLVGNCWYPLALGLRRREARDLVRTLTALLLQNERPRPVFFEATS